MEPSKVINFLFLCWLVTDLTISVEFKRVSQGLTEIPVIDIPTDVEFIDLSDNEICTTDPVPTYPSLRRIVLEGNCLTTFPDFCNVNQTLKKLDVSKNEILEIAEELIRCLKNLEELMVGDNHLSAYPVVRLDRLTFLGIARNDLINLPLINIIAPNVEGLQVSGNPLDADSILDVISEVGATLENLALKNLDLKHLDVAKLELFQCLDFIGLDLNQFDVIPELGQSVKQSLSTLKLSRNPIANVRPQDLREFANLVLIELQNCQITRIPELCQIKPGLVIDLSDNPLVCDCHAKELKMAAEAGVLTLSDAPCQKPAELKNIPLSSIAMDQLNCPTTDTFREFAVYQTNPELFSCGMMKAAITVVESSSPTGCSTQCISQPACGGYHFTHDNCSLYEFGINHHDNITVSRGTYIIN